MYSIAQWDLILIIIAQKSEELFLFDVSWSCSTEAETWDDSLELLRSASFACRVLAVTWRRDVSSLIAGVI